VGVGEVVPVELSGEGDLKALRGCEPPSLALSLLCSSFLRKEDCRAEGRSSRGGTVGGNVSAPSGLGLWSLSNALRYRLLLTLSTELLFFSSGRGS